MNVIYIIYLVNNKVGLVVHLLPFKFEVMGSIPKKTPKPISKTRKERCWLADKPSQYPKLARIS